MRSLLFIVILFSFMGCQQRSPSSENQILQNPQKKSNNTIQNIIGGTDVQRSHPIASFTVGLYDQKLGFICTGSLIESNVVITAAHCIESAASQLTLVFDLDFSGLDSQNQKVLRQVTEVKVHEGFKNRFSKDLDWDDIALVHFKGSAPEGYKPVQILEDTSLLKRGSTVHMAGYGAEKVELEEVFQRDKKFREGLKSGEIVCTDKSEEYCYRLNFSGLDLLRTTSATIEGFTEKEIRMNESKGHGTCVGDSGGPLLLESDGNYYLVGLTSRGSEICDGPAIYTNVLEYVDWITSP